MDRPVDPVGNARVRTHRVTCALTLVAVALATTVASAGEGAPERATGSQSEGIVGSWQALEYVLRDGPTHRVDGHIFFSRDDWTVLFFVLDEGEPRRASAEGGTYTLEGDRLTFRHRYNASGGGGLEGLPASDWSMTVRAPGEEPAEPCRISLDGERLTIHFPSGNHMTFRRSSR